MGPAASTFSKRRIIIAVMIAAALAAVAAIAIYLLTRPNQQEYQAAKTTQITEATKARQALAPAVNAYLAAFKAAYNETDSAQQASVKAKPEFDAYTQAEQKASQSLSALTDSRIANDAETGDALNQLKADYQAEVRYYTGLVESYADYTNVFAKDADQCAGILVGESDGLSGRKRQLDAAATKCYAALDALKRSSNQSYVDYAKKIERRVKDLQAYAATTVQAEAKLKQFEAKAAEYQRGADEATARGASEDELNKLADELKRFNAQIADNRADFDFAASRYISTVKELPTLYEDVYAKQVPAKLNYYGQLNKLRMDVFSLVIDSKIEPSA